MKSPDNSSLVYTSPSLLNNDVRTIETCLAASTNSQYVLRMQDSDNTAWLEVYGVNGNRTLKVMMTETTQEDTNMSLYAPINKNAEWKLSSSAESVWKETSFADASWTSVTLSSTTQQLTEPSTCAKPSRV